MKKIYLITAATALLLIPTSCMQEFQPQGSSVTQDQAAKAPGSYENFVSSITSQMTQFVFNSSSYRQPNDFGYPGLYVRRDMMGQDMVAAGQGYNWFNTWYQCGVGLAPIYLDSQYPWTYYFSGIQACNTVLKLAGDEPDENHKVGAGAAYFFRALYNLEMAQMFAPLPYGVDKNSPTVPIITDKIDLVAATENPRATNEEMFSFILSDLDKAEALLTGYSRGSDKTMPDVSVVYGAKARAYLLMEDWVNAEKYAKQAQQGYSVMTAAEYTDRNNGFNDMNSNNAWMLACRYSKDGDVMLHQTGNHSWGSWFVCELPPNSYGYYTTYGAANIIDRHLYSTIPSTDARKKCFLDFSIDALPTKAAQIAAISAYSDVPEYVWGTGNQRKGGASWGGMPLKFRAKGGNHETNLDAYLVDVPMMRVEEMVLIEAEAAGRQNEARGIQILTDFAKTRDPNYVYGEHNEAYNNFQTSAFVNEIWWQRRVEFWGEGMSLFDIKRLQKGIIRSYAGTNHVDGYRWNTQTPPDWMNFCIVQTESNYNGALINNPTPIAPKGNSPEHEW